MRLQEIIDQRTEEKFAQERMFLQKQITVGERRGEKRGERRGITIGSHDARVDTARAFLQMGLSVQQVAQGTGLSIDEVQSLL